MPFQTKTGRAKLIVFDRTEATEIMNVVKADFRKFKNESDIFALESALTYVRLIHTFAFPAIPLKSVFDSQGKLQLSKLHDMISSLGR